MPLSMDNIALGAIGGVIPSLLTLVQWARTDRNGRPRIPFSDPGFWVLVCLLPAMGGGVVGLYEHFGTQFNGLLAFQVGVTAPAFLQQLASAAPPLGPKG